MSCKPSFLLADQLALFRGAERDVPRRVESQPVLGEVQAERDDVRRLIKTDLGRVDMVPRPGAAGGRRLLAKRAQGEAALPPILPTTQNPLSSPHFRLATYIHLTL